MLEAIELLPARRRSPRHACRLDVPIVCDLWDEPVPLRTRDLSVDGLYFETELPLEPGTELVLELRVGGETHFVIGSVRRAELGRHSATSNQSAGMGIELLDMDDDCRRAIQRAIRRRPPALPRRRSPIEKKLVWVDVLLTYEEDLGDRVNIFEVSEAIGMSEVEDECEEFDDAFAQIAPRAVLLH